MYMTSIIQVKIAIANLMKSLVLIKYYILYQLIRNFAYLFNGVREFSKTAFGLSADLLRLTTLARRARQAVKNKKSVQM
jgi:hypothetical protein